MTLLFLVVLAMAWAAVFVPAAVRARQEAPVSSTERFKRGMGVLAGPQRRRGRWIITPGASDRARRRTLDRRRKLFTALVFAASMSFALALVRSSLWDLNLIFDAALVTYSVVLISLKRQQEQSRRTVAHLPLSEDRHASVERAVGDLEFQEPPRGLLDPYETLEPSAEAEEVEFYEAVHVVGGNNG